MAKLFLKNIPSTDNTIWITMQLTKRSCLVEGDLETRYLEKMFKLSFLFFIQEDDNKVSYLIMLLKE